MVLLLSSKISNILNYLIMQGASKNSDDIDIQLKKIINKIETCFKDNEIEIVLDWFHESIKKEIELKMKRINNPHVYNKPKIALLISKTNMLHSKIVDLLIERIDYYFEEGGSQTKMMANDLSNTFLTNLTENRKNDEILYDNYIKVISDAMKIFSL